MKFTELHHGQELDFNRYLTPDYWVELTIKTVVGLIVKQLMTQFHFAKLTKEQEGKPAAPSAATPKPKRSSPRW